MASADTQHAVVNGDAKFPSSITRVYDIPVVKDSVNYADSLIKSYSLPAAVYRNAEALATTIYKKAGEPIQDRLQPQIDQLDGLANKGLDYVQGKAPFLFDAKTDDLVATARKPADQAYSTARGYQDLVSGRLHDTLVHSQQTLGGLQERLSTAAATATAAVPKNGKEAQDVAHHLYENLEKIRDTVLKQSGELPAHVSKAVQPYIEKLQKGVGEVKSELAQKDTPVHVKAQHIIAITKEITTESLHDAIETLKQFVQRNPKLNEAKENGTKALHQAKAQGEEAVESANQNGTQALETGKSEVKQNGAKAHDEVEQNGADAQGQAKEAGERAKETGEKAVESAEHFVEEHTPGDVSYAEAVKEGEH